MSGLGLNLGMGFSHGSVINPLEQLLSGAPSGDLLNFWDFKDLSTLFQTTDETTPVTALTQQIQRCNDKGDSGNNLTEATNPPVLAADSGGLGRTAKSDGVDDFLTTGVDINTILPSTFEMFVAGQFNAADADSANPWENDAVLGDDSGYFCVYARSSDLLGVYLWDTGVNKVEIAYTVGNRFVASIRKTSTDLYMSIDGGSESTDTADALSTDATTFSVFRGPLYGDVNLERVIIMSPSTWLDGKRSQIITLLTAG